MSVLKPADKRALPGLLFLRRVCVALQAITVLGSEREQESAKELIFVTHEGELSCASLKLPFGDTDFKLVIKKQKTQKKA